MRQARQQEDIWQAGIDTAVGWGAVRSGKGLFLSADEQGRAGGKQLDMQPALEQLQRALQQAQALSEANGVAEADLLDVSTQQTQMDSVLKALQDAAILLSAPAGIREAFLSPLADLHYRTHESEWQQIVGYNRPRQPFLPRITLTQAQEDQLIEHAQPADMLYRFAKGGFIDARLPYAQRHAQLERYAKRARAWGFSNTRDVEIFCRYCCCNGEDFDRTPETTAVLHSLLAEQTSLKALPGLIVLNLPPYLAITGLLE
ncbi:type VI secretion system Vgr family protein [Silvimonas soli]|uniref:type VI secretion system Vgr family protein n=1 Tax=Silvimonas soli TaxID=2980100 RepID=UPI0024B3730A|nr:type VI secretion system Vgr family protein [Silvimonas soli]